MRELTLLTGPTVVCTNNVFDLYSDEIRAGAQYLSLRQLAPHTNQPVLCQLNGDFVLPHDLDYVPRAGDHVRYSILPLGGGGGNSQTLLGVALIVAGVITSGVGGANLITAGVSLIALGLISSTSVSAMSPVAQGESPSPTYSIQLSGNSARMGQAVPVIYGTHILLPDFASQPYSEYDEDDQQFYHALLCLGMMDDFTVRSVTIDDTDLSHFTDVETQYVGPAFPAPLSLVELGVVNAPEVSANDLKYGQYVGPFAVCGPGLECAYIGYDVSAPKGLFLAEADGTLTAKSASWFVEIRRISATGAAISAWSLLDSGTLSGATNKPLRRSYKVAVTPGRYEVRMTRTTVEDDNNRAAHGLQWIGLRAYLQLDTALDPNASFLALRMRATSQLSGISQRKVALIIKRWLPSWHPDDGWLPAAATDSIAWALADVLKNGTYGPAVSDERIDLQTLYELNAEWTARGDTFNGVFDKRVTVWQALTSIARAGRARPIMRGNVFTFVRDSLQSLPVALYSMRNITRNSFGIDYALIDDDEPDHIIAEYFDGITWSTKYVTVDVPGAVDRLAPLQISLFGVTNERQAMREALSAAADVAYRRARIKFDTELEGFLPSYGSLIAVTHDLLGVGSSGEILEWDGTTATCSEDVVWSAGTNYAILTDEYGEIRGPYRVTAGSVAGSMTFIDTVPGGIVSISTGRELTRYAVGEVSTYSKMCKIVGLTPGERTVSIEAVIEDDRVHSADAAYLGGGGGGGGDGGSRVGRYAPDGLPPYPAASDAERARYGYYADDSLLVGGTDEGYLYDA